MTMTILLKHEDGDDGIKSHQTNYISQQLLSTVVLNRICQLWDILLDCMLHSGSHQGNWINALTKDNILLSTFYTCISQLHF